MSEVGTERRSASDAPWSVAAVAAAPDASLRRREERKRVRLACPIVERPFERECRSRVPGRVLGVVAEERRAGQELVGEFPVPTPRPGAR